jgi:quinol monooxygenase YgiN
MILEQAILRVDPERTDAFEAAMREALPIIESDPGCRGAVVRRQIEDPTTYVLLVEWTSVAAHTEGFRTSDAFTRWRQLTHPFYVEPPAVTHLEDPIER